MCYFLNHPSLCLKSQIAHALPSLILLASASELNPANTTLSWKNKKLIKNIFEMKMACLWAVRLTL